MTDAAYRLSAVIAALEKIKEHVEQSNDDLFHTSGYNRWVSMLEGVVDGSWAGLKLPDEEIPTDQYLMHVDAAIAFLSEHT